MARTAQWGHWGITFSEVDVYPGTAHQIPGTLKVVGYIGFPVSTRGPVDQPRRDEYLAMINAWQRNDILPTDEPTFERYRAT